MEPETAPNCEEEKSLGKLTLQESSPSSCLLDVYKFTEEQKRIFRKMKGLRNMPFNDDLAEEEIIWAVAVATIGLPNNEPSASDLRFVENAAEERIRRLVSAEKRFGWFSLRWTKPLMRRLLIQWFCGMLVIVPELQTRDGSPIQFVHEYYGEESEYPDPDGQTDAWKNESIDLYVLMARSTCRAYPTATTKGIVSFSDMKDFDWSKYDMSSKERNSDISSLVPNKLRRMITFHPDDKMRGFYKDMGLRARKKWGFEQYEDFKSAVMGEGDFLPKELPTFVGGTYRVDIYKCLEYLFRREPEALTLLADTHSEMKQKGEIPRPKHMEE